MKFFVSLTGLENRLIEDKDVCKDVRTFEESVIDTIRNTFGKGWNCGLETFEV